MKRLLAYLVSSAILTSLCMGGVSLYLYQQHLDQQDWLTDSLQQQSLKLATQLDSLSVHANQQIRFLSHLKLTQQSFAQQQPQFIEDSLWQLMTNSPNILQARLLSLTGQEQLKIIATGQKLSLLEQAQLQNKSHRYYVQELLATPQDQVYFSPIDLNIEHGKIETPYHPVLRVAQAVVNPLNNQRLGYVLLNYDIKNALSKLYAQLPASMELFVTDKNGQYLYHPNEQARYCNHLHCTAHWSNDTPYQNPHGLTFFKQRLASITLANGSHLNHALYGAIITRFKLGYHDWLSQDNTLWAILSGSRLWWLALCLSLCFCGMLSCSIELRMKQLSETWRRIKMFAVLEKITDMIEQLHEGNDPVTGSHVQRVSYYSWLLASHADLAPSMVEDIRRFSSLHDLGKITIPDQILNKPGKLHGDEWLTMQTHVENGYQLLKEFDLSSVAENIVRGHHEKWDGSGYPQQLAGESIPIEARIVSLVDCFDALMSRRPYKAPFSFERSSTIINSLSGSAFQPELVDLFNQLQPEFKKFRTPDQTAAVAQNDELATT